jgi:hypothetical protein
VAEILAPWQHCLAGHRVLIGKGRQLEKIRHCHEQNGFRAKKPGKNTLLPGKARLNCGLHFEIRSQKYIHILSFVYEDGIKIKNKYFATIYELHICPIKPSAGLASLRRLSL